MAADVESRSCVQVTGANVAGAFVALLLATAGVADGHAQTQPSVRSVAVTFDDLPAVSTRRDIAVQSAITDALLTTLVRQGVPATGFVIEGSLAVDGQPDPARVALLERWLDAGMALGNHTFSHHSLHQTPLDTYQEDVVRGEAVTRALLAQRGQTLEWFRHPMLHTGRDLDTKRLFAEFLNRHGYRIAPVTIDNSDWIFARAWDRAFDRGDSAAARRIGEAYVPYMDTVFGYYEQQSRMLLGREPPQILLLHANRINAHLLEDMIAMMRRRGYRFIALESAFADPAYRRRDEYIGPAGITWLHRWAIAAGWKGTDFRGEPQVPQFVIDEAGSRN